MLRCKFYTLPIMLLALVLTGTAIAQTLATTASLRADQHPAYLEVQLKEFGKRERSNDNAVLHTVASKLTELEVRAVSVYIGALP